MRAKTVCTLDAQTIAVAIVACAKVFGDDPVAALTGGPRRCLPPAACALVEFGTGLAAICRVLGLNPGSVKAVRTRPYGAFRPAMAAAMEAVTLHRSNPATGLATGPTSEPEAPEPQAVPPRPVGPPKAKLVQVARRPIAPTVQVPAESLGGRILAALARGPGTPRGLATILDAKEELVGREINMLQHAGRIRAGEMPDSGRRDQRWYLAQDDAA